MRCRSWTRSCATGWSVSPMRETARFAATAVAVRAVALSLRLFGYAATSGWLRIECGLSRLKEKGDSPHSIAARVSRAAAGIIPVGCLPRALLSAAILERHGFEVAVRIGVRRDGDTLAAHAWVEHEDRKSTRLNSSHLGI